MRRAGSTGLVWLLALALQAGSGVRAERRWEHVIASLETERDELAAALEETHGLLLERARAEDPSLVELLSPQAPKPRPAGYGILPRLDPNLVEKSLPPPVGPTRSRASRRALRRSSALPPCWRVAPRPTRRRPSSLW